MSSKLGWDVLYTATENDVRAMKRRRDDATAFQRRANATAAHSETPIEAGDLAGRSGHIAHMGNELTAGQRYAAKIVKDWGGSQNLQVFLDGNDILWVTSVSEGDGPGNWSQR